MLLWCSSSARGHWPTVLKETPCEEHFMAASVLAFSSGVLALGAPLERANGPDGTGNLLEPN